MSKEERVLLCRLVADGPATTHCTIDRCADCKRRVWVALSSPQYDIALCPSCTDERWVIDPNPTILPLTDEQLRDIVQGLERLRSGVEDHD